MGKCTRCNAELIAAAKFCASCGAPTTPASNEPAPAIAAESGPSVVMPAVPVNPFAATATPSSAVSIEAREARAQVAAAEAAREKAAPPPEASPISPLAVSNALSQRGAFQQAIESAKEKVRLSQPPPAPNEGVAPPKKKPGTQMMQQAPTRYPTPREAALAAPEPAAKKAAARTVAMAFNPRASGTGGGAPQSVAPAAMPASVHQPQPQSVIAPSQAQPPSMPQAAPASQLAPAAYAAPAYPPSAVAPAGRGWNPAPVPPQPFSYAFQGYAPGARVLVTWSNGQRYPATVMQVSGTQCLVVFPDGQQHWVEMPYVSPG